MLLCVMCKPSICQCVEACAFYVGLNGGPASGRRASVNAGGQAEGGQMSRMPLEGNAEAGNRVCQLETCCCNKACECDSCVCKILLGLDSCHK